jgi:acyl-CoA reductase-like NAD-dependent aldehyde dehydrogenase
VPRERRPRRRCSPESRPHAIAAKGVGGYKMSGCGRESGVEHMLEDLQTKAVWIKTV